MVRTEPSHPLRATLGDYRLALGSRAYRRRWLAAVISRTGDTLNFTALPLFVSAGRGTARGRRRRPAGLRTQRRQLRYLRHRPPRITLSTTDSREGRVRMAATPRAASPRSRDSQ